MQNYWNEPEPEYYNNTPYNNNYGGYEKPATPEYHEDPYTPEYNKPVYETYETQTYDEPVRDYSAVFDEIRDLYQSKPVYEQPRYEAPPQYPSYQDPRPSYESLFEKPQTQPTYQPRPSYP